MDYKKIEEIFNSSNLSTGLHELASIYDSDCTERRVISVLYYIKQDFYLFEANDNPFSAYDKNNCTNALWDTLFPILELKIPNIFLAKLHDFGWHFYRKKDCAEKAFSLYLNEIKFLPKGHNLISCFCRCISISKSLNNSLFKESIKNIVADIIEKYTNDDSSPYKTLNLCFSNSILEADELLDICDRLDILSSINHKEYYEFKIKLLSKSKRKSKKSDITNIRRKLAELYKSLIDESDCFRSIRFIKSALLELQKIPNTDTERHALYKLLSKLQKESLSKMSSHKIPFDFEKETLFIQECLKTDNYKEALVILDYVTQMPTYENTKNSVLENLKSSPFALFFPTEHLNDRGKTIASMPCKQSTELSNEDLEAHIYSYLSNNNYSISSLLITPVIEKFKTSGWDLFSIAKEIVSKSFFVPNERKKAFTIGLYSGLNGDYITALSILIPQFEYALRCLAEELDGIIYSLEEDGSEHIRMLDGIINLPEVKACLDESVLMNTKALFASKYGANIRNLIAHGMIDDESFNSSLCIYAWAFIFKLCYIWQAADTESDKIWVETRQKITLILNKYMKIDDKENGSN